MIEEGNPALDDMLESTTGQNASDLAAVRFAIQHGWTLEKAVQSFAGSPELKAAILLEAISKREFV